MKVAIIGAGGVGSAAARFIAKAGHETHVYEQFRVGHDKGSSHGTSRIIRKSYPDPYYTALMNETYPLWFELEREAKETLHVQTGILIFGKPSSEWLIRTRESLRTNEVPFEELSAKEVAKRFGGFHLEDEEVAIFQPEAGVLKADKIIEMNLRLAHGYGAKIFEETEAEIPPDGSVLTKKGKESYDAITICAGAWIKKFAPLNVEVRLQHFAYFDAPIAKRIPVWVEAGPDHFYGFPDYGRGFKIGLHRYGPVFDPSIPERNVDQHTLSEIQKCARFRLGATSTPNVVQKDAYTCLYTVAPNEDFQIGRLPCQVPTYFVSACSGHGFKFAIWFGKLLLDFVEGKKKPEDFPRFFVPK